MGCRVHGNRDAIRLPPPPVPPGQSRTNPTKPNQTKPKAPPHMALAQACFTYHTSGERRSRQPKDPPPPQRALRAMIVPLSRDLRATSSAASALSSCSGGSWAVGCSDGGAKSTEAVGEKRHWGTRGGGAGIRPWWLALFACGGAYWPLALEPSAVTSGHPHYCGHPHCRGHPPAWAGIQNAFSAHGVLP